MRVKLYRAAGMSAAMALIRAELGPEALILSTRRVGTGVEVTAALEPDDVSAAAVVSAELSHAPEPVGAPAEAGTEFDGHAHRAAAFGSPDGISRGRGGTMPGDGRGWSPPRGPDGEGEPTARLGGLSDAVSFGLEAALRSGNPAAAERIVAASRTSGAEHDPRLSVGARPGSRSSPTDSSPGTPAFPAQRLRPQAGTDGAEAVETGSVEPMARADRATPTARKSVAIAPALPRAPPVGRPPAPRRDQPDEPRLPAGAPHAAVRAGSSLADTRHRTAALDWHGVPPPLAGRLAAGPLAFALSIALPFAALDLATGAAPVLVAGPPGAGKTLTVARLATRLVLAGCKPLVVTADGRRAGATEQLAAFTRLLGLHLLVASTPAALARALARREDGGPVLIDAPGVDPFVPAQMAELSALAATGRAVVALVCPAGLDPHEAADIGAAYRQLGATILVANRLDVGRRLGGVLAAASAGLAMAEAGIGPGVADGLVALTPDLLARRLATVPGQT